MKKSKRSCKILLFISLFVFLDFSAFAQPFRYTNSIFNKVDTLKEVEYARAQWLNNPVSIASQYDININEGESITEERPLLMDIFMPHNDTVEKTTGNYFYA